MDKKTLELLYRSFDSKLNRKEQKKLEEALDKSGNFQSHKKEILKMRDLIKSNNPKGFGYMFADRVLEKIKILEDKSSDELFFDSLISIFRPIAFAAAFLLVFLVSYNLITGSGNLFNGSQQSQDITLAEAFDPYNEITLE